MSHNYFSFRNTVHSRDQASATADKDLASFQLRSRRSENYEIQTSRRAVQQSCHRPQISDLTFLLDDPDYRGESSLAGIIQRLNKKGDLRSMYSLLQYSIKTDSISSTLTTLTKSGIMDFVMNCFTGPSKLKVPAGQCLVNLSCGNKDQRHFLTKHIGSYCISYLKYESDDMKIICAWILGNLCELSKKTCDLLKEMNIICNTLLLISSRNLEERRVGFYLTSQYSQHNDDLNSNPEFQALLFKELIEYDTNNEEVYWALFHFTSNQPVDDTFCIAIVTKIVMAMYKDVTTKASENINYFTSIPFIRILGNMFIPGREKVVRILQNWDMFWNLVCKLLDMGDIVKHETKLLLSNAITLNM